MIQVMIMGIYLFILAIDDMLNKSVRVGLLIAGLIPVAISFIPGGSEIQIWQRAAGLIPGLLLIVAAGLTREKIGYGDGIILLITGIAIGIGALCKLLMISFFLLPVYSIAMLARGRLNKKSRIPFLPFVFAGYVLISVA